MENSPFEAEAYAIIVIEQMHLIKRSYSTHSTVTVGKIVNHDRDNLLVS